MWGLNFGFISMKLLIIFDLWKWSLVVQKTPCKVSRTPALICSKDPRPMYYSESRKSIGRL